MKTFWISNENISALRLKLISSWGVNRRETYAAGETKVCVWREDIRRERGVGGRLDRSRNNDYHPYRYLVLNGSSLQVLSYRLLRDWLNCCQEEEVHFNAAKAWERNKSRCNILWHWSGLCQWVRTIKELNGAFEGFKLNTALKYCIYSS